MLTHLLSPFFLTLSRRAVSISSSYFFISTFSWTHSNRTFIFSLPLLTLVKVSNNFQITQVDGQISILILPDFINTIWQQLVPVYWSLSFFWLRVLFSAGFTHTSLAIPSYSPLLLFPFLNFSIAPHFFPSYTHSPGHLIQSHDFDFHQCTNSYLYLQSFLWVLDSFIKLSFSKSPHES